VGTFRALFLRVRPWQTLAYLQLLQAVLRDLRLHIFPLPLTVPPVLLEDLQEVCHGAVLGRLHSCVCSVLSLRAPLPVGSRGLVYGANLEQTRTMTTSQVLSGCARPRRHGIDQFDQRSKTDITEGGKFQLSASIANCQQQKVAPSRPTPARCTTPFPIRATGVSNPGPTLFLPSLSRVRCGRGWSTDRRRLP